MDVPFNQPRIGDVELEYIRESLSSGRVSGDGPFTRRCSDLLEKIYGGTVLLMHSCTAALEAAVILADIKPGDEVIMPSFTFVSTANAVVLRGGVPVFVDVRSDTLNIDESKIEAALTEKTRAIIPVHYAGIGAAMTQICELADHHGLSVIEDAAQGFGASYEGRPLGSIGALGCLSFHETKNVVSGEGGALLVNSPALAERAQFIREKGTNRTHFLRKETTKYEWVDIGSSYLPSDIIAALLLAQLENASEITSRRLAVWDRYDVAFRDLQNFGNFTTPAVPQGSSHNAHIYYVITPSYIDQQNLILNLRAEGIVASSHYVPLHSSLAGKRYAKAVGEMNITDEMSSRIVRLPLHANMTDGQVDFVISMTRKHIAGMAAG